MKPLFFFAPIYEIFWTKFGVMIFLIILAEQFGLLFDAVENKKKVYKYFFKKLKVGENKLVVWCHKQDIWRKKATTRDNPQKMLFLCVA